MAYKGKLNYPLIQPIPPEIPIENILITILPNKLKYKANKIVITIMRTGNTTLRQSWKTIIQSVDNNARLIILSFTKVVAEIETIIKNIGQMFDIVEILPGIPKITFSGTQIINGIKSAGLLLITNFILKFISKATKIILKIFKFPSPLALLKKILNIGSNLVNGIIDDLTETGIPEDENNVSYGKKDGEVKFFKTPREIDEAKTAQLQDKIILNDLGGGEFEIISIQKN